MSEKTKLRFRTAKELSEELEREEQAAARAAHEANRAYCQYLGDDSQPPWKDAPDWQRESCIQGVRAIAADPDTTPAQQHYEWMRTKLVEGWTYGDTKDVEAKTHPCMKPYDELPPEQQFKDKLFDAVVRAVLFGGE